VGVTVLINNNFDPNVHIVQTDPQGRWIILNMLLDNKQIGLINLYGPNNDDPSFFENIYKNLSTQQATLDSIIMVGDFNTVLNTSMDRKGNHTTNYHPQAHLRKSLMSWIYWIFLFYLYLTRQEQILIFNDGLGTVG
jgi:exonuclease III